MTTTTTSRRTVYSYLSRLESAILNQPMLTMTTERYDEATGTWIPEEA